MDENLKIFLEQNGIFIALDRQLLLSEFFSNSQGIIMTVKKTLLAMSFDVTQTSESQVERSDVNDYLMKLCQPRFMP
jgi:hypothetical protein